MDFGIPREVRDMEARVGLTPAGASLLVREGHTVYVEQGAGEGAGFSDDLYRHYGAQVVYSAAEVYGRSDVVAKVARPTTAEHALFRDGQTIFSFFHLPVASPDLLEALKARNITAVAGEMIKRADGVRPVIVPMSEVAGRLAPIIAGRMLMTTEGGRGTLLSGIPGVPRGSVAVVGGGVLGAQAARAFLGVGAQVIVLDSDIEKLQKLDADLSGRITTMLCTEYNLGRVTKFVDVIVGAVSITGRRTPILITRDMVKHMRPGTVIIDYSIDQGGCVETSRPTTLRDPTYVVDEVVHYGVPNVTSSVARTTSYGLTNSLLPYLTQIGRHGILGTLEKRPSLLSGIVVLQGELVNPTVAAALGMEVERDLTYPTETEAGGD